MSIIIENGPIPNTSNNQGFEGPEKRLEIDFKPNPQNPKGLRTFTSKQWQTLLDLAKCTIISSKSNEYFDSYVLSESSLFVYPYKVMLKTCGTTTLLKCIPKLLEYAKICDLTVEFVMFSRKNFLFPNEQSYPHNHWSSEVKYLNEFFEGSAYVLGPLTQEHWYLYVADYHDGERRQTEQTLELMMHDLDPDIAKKFYKSPTKNDKDEFPGVADIIPGSETDEFNFDPCGYSMNGLFKNSFYTIHVTPEPHCSYASFETNVSLSCYKKLLSKVLQLFKPGSLTLTLFSEKTNVEMNHSTLHDLNIEGFDLRHQTFSQLEGNCDIMLCNYVSCDNLPRKAKKPRKNPPSVIS